MICQPLGFEWVQQKTNNLHLELIFVKDNFRSLKVIIHSLLVQVCSEIQDEKKIEVLNPMILQGKGFLSFQTFD